MSDAMDEVREALADLLSFEYRRGVSCQKNAFALGGGGRRCLCRICIEERARATLSRLSAQAEPTGDARELMKRVRGMHSNADVLRGQYDDPSHDLTDDEAAAEIKGAFQARLSASGQRCDKCEYRQRAERAEVMQVGQSASGQGEAHRECDDVTITPQTIGRLVGTLHYEPAALRSRLSEPQPASESAEELARAVVMEGSLSTNAGVTYPGARLIAAHDAETRRDTLALVINYLDDLAHAQEIYEGDFDGLTASILGEGKV